MRPRLFLLFVLFYLCQPSKAQVPERAQKHFDKAMDHKRLRKHDKAITEMQDAIKNYPAYREAYSVLGEWFFQARRYEEAAKTFRAASNAIPQGQASFSRPLAKSLLYGYHPDQALQVLNSYKPVKENREWTQLKDNAVFMQKAMRGNFRDTIYNLGNRINTPYPEMFPGIAADTQTLYFTRRVNGEDDELFRAKLDSCGGWFRAKNMGSPPNTPDHESAQMISGDGHYLFFTRCDARSENGWGQGGCDLLMAYTADSTWSVPQSFGATINTPAYEGMACLSADNRELFYVSDRNDGYGGMDIWVSRFEYGLWQPPRNMGPAINTAGDETAPFLHIDNNTLYFSSTGHTGMGGNDLYYCRRINDTTWSAPQNMGYPINTSANEHSISITMDGKKAFFSSDRDSVLGNYDIYEVNMPHTIQPVPVAIIKGFSYDSLSKDKLNYASIYIADATTGNQLYHFTSNRGDGSYMMTLPVGMNYVCNADRVGYLDITDTIRLAHIDTTSKMEYNIALLPQGYTAPVTDSLILTVFFPKNSAALTDSDKHMIQQAISPWVGGKYMQVLVNGFTDNTGTPLINEELSYMRAGLVTDQLTAFGIDASLIESHGWGEASPIASNDTDETRSYNRRVEIVIRW